MNSLINLYDPPSLTPPIINILESCIEVVETMGILHIVFRLRGMLISFLPTDFCSTRTGIAGDVGVGADTAALGVAGGAFRRVILNGNILLLS
jgi:hypothetical protein